MGKVLKLSNAVQHQGVGVAKRFTETKKWEKQWFMELPIKTKLLWLYLCDNCDGYGVWDVNFALAGVKIGAEITHQDVLNLGTRVVAISGDKLWIPGWILFHYKKLNPTNKVHVAVARKLSPLVRDLILDCEARKLIAIIDQILSDAESTPDRGSFRGRSGDTGRRKKEKGILKEEGVGETQIPPIVTPRSGCGFCKNGLIRAKHRSNGNSETTACSCAIGRRKSHFLKFDETKFEVATA